jgi:hypothetical protein
MAKALANVRIYGDAGYGVYCSAYGAAAPTAPTALAAPAAGYTEVGWCSEDGATFGRESESADFFDWSGTLMRSKHTSNKDTVHFQALEENAVTAGLYYRGVAPTVATGVATMVVTNQTRTDFRYWVFDMKDGAYTKRVVGYGEVSEVAELVHNKDNMTVYDFTVTLSGDYTIITNSPGIVGP